MSEMSPSPNMRPDAHWLLKAAAIATIIGTSIAVAKVIGLL
jgi:hypothetical protein